MVICTCFYIGFYLFEVVLHLTLFFCGCFPVSNVLRTSVVSHLFVVAFLCWVFVFHCSPLCSQKEIHNFAKSNVELVQVGYKLSLTLNQG